MKKTKKSAKRGVKKLECCGRQTHAATCRCCDGKVCPSLLYNGDFCEDCMVLYYNQVKRVGSDYQLRGARQCAIPGCSNTSCQGLFVGQFCAPCHYYIIGTSCGSEMNPSFGIFQMRTTSKGLRGV